MRIIDGFLDSESFVAMRDALVRPDFPLLHTAIVTKPASRVPAAANRQDVHGFFLRTPTKMEVSDHFEVIRPAVDRLRPELLLRVKLNVTRRQATHVEYGMHVDTRHPGATTAILYLNTNNGYTVFEDGRKVESVENRLVIFDAARRHTGASCTDAKSRAVLNFNMVMSAPG